MLYTLDLDFMCARHESLCARALQMKKFQVNLALEG